MLKLGLFPNIYIPSGASYDEATQALLDQASSDGYTAASGTALTALDAFITALKDDGIWDLLDVLWLPATNGDSDFACYNLKDPTQFNLTKVNSPIFTSLEGFTGDGVSAYLDTNYDASVDGVNYSANEAHTSVYSRTPESNPTGMMGGVRDGATQTYISIGNANSYNRINVNATTESSASGSGFYILGRNGGNSGDEYVYKNGVDITTGVGGNSNGIPSGNFYLLARNPSNNEGNGQASFYSIGGDLSSKASEFYTAIQNYMTSIGKNV